MDAQFVKASVSSARENELVLGIFESKSGGKGHVVKQVTAKDGTTYLTCTCPGGRFAFTGTQPGRGCWAMQAVRKQFGL